MMCVKKTIILFVLVSMLVGCYSPRNIVQKQFNQYNSLGYDRSGYDRAGFDKYGYNRAGFDKHGYDEKGYNVNGYNKEGYDVNGFNSEGKHKRGFLFGGMHSVTGTQYDLDGYDINGFNKDGIDNEGYDTEGFDGKGYNRWGYDRDGYDRGGFNVDGIDRKGFNRDGFNKDGVDREGYNIDGYDKEGYDRNGFNKLGFNRSRFNKFEKRTYSKEEFAGFGDIIFGVEYDKALQYLEDKYDNVQSYETFIKIYGFLLGDKKVDVSLSFDNKKRFYHFRIETKSQTANYFDTTVKNDALYLSRIFAKKYGNPRHKYNPHFFRVSDNYHTFYWKWYKKSITVYTGLAVYESKYYAVAVVYHDALYKAFEKFKKNKERKSIKSASENF